MGEYDIPPTIPEQRLAYQPPGPYPPYGSYGAYPMPYGRQDTIDYSTPFGLPFKVPRGWGVLAIGGVLLLFSWLIVPALIVMGYCVELGRRTAVGNYDLPRFRFGMIADGFKAAVVMLIYALPLYIVMAAVFVPLVVWASQHPDSTQQPPQFLGGFFLLFPLVGLYGIALAGLQPAIFAVFIADGRIKSCLSPSRIKAVIRPHGGAYIGVAAILYGIALGAELGVIAAVIGVAFTFFYYLFVYACFAGQLARGVMAPPPGGWPPSPAAKAPAAPYYPGYGYPGYGYQGYGYPPPQGYGWGPAPAGPPPPPPS